ncbi:MAG: metalloregulator ArsR/SmtB family transcription factor [Erysipelotrichaceae bacterium]|nr:metalloregulator ArsR/SmtB family transcription factor [Erysipelotrichaceae bacterium]MDY5251222.1 metalloregulator ArsR/SmtB family transcription factor [Erysipelotrichaceae bacterium]
MDVLTAAKLYKALSDEKRLRIIVLLQQGEKCACWLMAEMDMAQSALSYHMKILVDADIVKQRPQGKWMHYSLNAETFAKAIAHLESLRS